MTRCYLILSIIIWICSFQSSFAQAIEIRGSDFEQSSEIYFNTSKWFFHPGELSREQLRANNTNGWDSLNNTSFAESNAPARWKGIGYFGLWIKVDTTLVNKKLNFRINHDGASELFIDGKPIAGIGKVGTSADEMQAMRSPRTLMPVWFDNTRPHLIIIHYSNFTPVYPDFIGFQLSLGKYDVIAPRTQRNNAFFNFVPLCAAAQLILALLHFFIFVFYRKQKLNLYYSLFVLLTGINAIFVYLFYQTSLPSVQYFAEFMTTACKVLTMWSGVVLLYVLHYGYVPRVRGRILSTISVLFLIFYGFQFLFYPALPEGHYFSIVFFCFTLDGCWSVWQVIRRKQNGAWLIGAGVIAVILLYFFAWADVFRLWPYPLNPMRVFVMSAGALILPLCFSLYLAIDFAQTNQSLTARLQEVEQLSAHALKQETEKREFIASEAQRLEELVQVRTNELKEKADKLREADSMKSRLFTNITHEFRTPLTLIINPAQELLNSDADAVTRHQHASRILSNANRLLELINQLLDLSKLEHGLMEVNLQPLDLVLLFRTHTLSCSSLAKQKNIKVHFTSDRDHLWLQGDRDKLEKLLLNLLSNSIKFTDHGQIEVSLLDEQDVLIPTWYLTVRDTGRGIPSAKLPHIFSRFYQADPSDTRSAEGTGIGLSVVKEFVELMGGRIQVESTEGVFTSIRIHMPYEPADAKEEITTEPLHTEEVLLMTSITPAVVQEDKPVVLIIEDHEELRDFLRQSLADKYRLLLASNGNDGIQLGLEHIPSLVITDLMMPGTDGYQVSTALKHDERTSHVPIIILTAKTDTDSRIQGIEAGADAYLGKPFDQRELFALTENLIHMRSQLREHYRGKHLWFSDALSMPSIERDFIGRVRKAVEAHMDDEGYGADQLASDIGLSRTQLHRKLKALIGQAPGELIRIVRLQHAHDLLKSRVATVAEVAYRVGFSSPASFSVSFSRHFGFPPKAVGTTTVS